MPRVIYSYADYDSEKSSVRMNIDSLANEASLRSAVEGVSIGVLQEVTKIDSVVQLSSASAASQWAQRETGLRVYVSDNVNGESGYFTIPCPDLGTLTLGTDGDVVLADAGIMAALVTAFNSYVLSRDENAVTVVRASIVGRSN